MPPKKNQQKSEEIAPYNYNEFAWRWRDGIEARRLMEEEDRMRIEREHYEYMRMMQQRAVYAYPLQAIIGNLGEPSMPKEPLYKKQIDALKLVEPRKVGKRVPDSVTPITGFRAWGIQMEKGVPHLKALGKNTIWTPMKQIEAECNSNQAHPAPNKECQCGIWSFKTIDNLTLAINSYSTKVVGSVSLWGRVIETENGFRAQYAYPKELWLLDSSLEELGNIYGVPVRIS